eukprot:CAMPEP_0184744830 /NCGR_PEP_ID=MMETSP0315-20130426/7548_1 /TAXON_ID=101924 /ORGANISM="Rhodosorus marinus, Strain UTEX LB 2760" /LENGTH=486 /DNA_ID=CAMNT_0027216715 /DNA_START=265 /DNA_END=1725 /DNA_ORIENTATION=-
MEVGTEFKSLAEAKAKIEDFLRQSSVAKYVIKSEPKRYKVVCPSRRRKRKTTEVEREQSTQPPCPFEVLASRTRIGCQLKLRRWIDHAASCTEVASSLATNAYVVKRASEIRSQDPSASVREIVERIQSETNFKIGCSTASKYMKEGGLKRKSRRMWMLAESMRERGFGHFIEEKEPSAGGEELVLPATGLYEYGSVCLTVEQILQWLHERNDQKRSILHYCLENNDEETLMETLKYGKEHLNVHRRALWLLLVNAEKETVLHSLMKDYAKNSLNSVRHRRILTCLLEYGSECLNEQQWSLWLFGRNFAGCSVLHYGAEAGCEMLLQLLNCGKRWLSPLQLGKWLLLTKANEETVLHCCTVSPLAEETLIILLNHGRKVLTMEQMRWWLLHTSGDGRSVLHYYVDKVYLGPESLKKLLDWGRACLEKQTAEWLLKRDDNDCTVLQYSVEDSEKFSVVLEFGRACLTMKQLGDWALREKQTEPHSSA